MEKIFENWRKSLSEQEKSIVIPEKYRGVIFYNSFRKDLMAAHPDGDHFVNANDEPIKLSKADRAAAIAPIFIEDIAFRKDLKKFEPWLSDYEIGIDLSYKTDKIYFPATIENLLLSNDSLYYEMEIKENYNTLGQKIYFHYYDEQLNFHPSSIYMMKYVDSVFAQINYKNKNVKYTVKFGQNDKLEWKVVSSSLNDKDEGFIKILYLLCQYTGMFDM